MSSMGVKMDQFQVPVCNSFQSTIFNGQLCYEVDLSRFSRKDDSSMESILHMGFVFLLDYNEDRGVILDKPSASLLLQLGVQKIYLKHLNLGLFHRRNFEYSSDMQAKIYLNTIGN